MCNNTYIGYIFISYFVHKWFAFSNISDFKYL